jgi:hypothetical protein
MLDSIYIKNRNYILINSTSFLRENNPTKRFKRLVGL